MTQRNLFCNNSVIFNFIIMTFQLPQLPYGYQDLEPFYDARTLEIHHSKHHQTYTDKLNEAISKAGIEPSSIEDILINLEKIPAEHQTALRNHGGGYYNHTFFWESMSPNSSQEKRVPEGSLMEAIENKFGSYEKFKNAFSTKAATHFGSGWAWLVMNQENELEIIDTHDQISPISLGYKPLLTIDVWEHAYYLKFQNKRPEWIETFFNIINWKKVEERFEIVK